MHSPISPSSAARWVNCPASPSLESIVGDVSSNEAHLEGEASHYAAALMLRGQRVAPGEFADNGHVLTAEMVECAAMYADVARGCDHIEELLQCPLVHPQSYGTPDAWCYDPSRRTIYIYDYKYGYRVVEVRENWQLINYVAGILSLHPDAVEVLMTIVQPRAPHRDGPVRSWRVSVAELLPYITRLQMMARVAMTPAEHYTKPGSHCRDCRARVQCDADQSAVMGYIEVVGQPMLIERSIEHVAAEVTLMRRAAAMIKHRLDAMETELVSRIKAGGVVQGYRLDSSVGRLSWDIDDEEIIRIGALCGRDLSAHKAITPTQASKVIDEAVIKQYSSRKSNGVVLVDDINDARAIFGGTNNG